WPRAVLALAAVLSVAAGISIVRFAKDPIEMDFNKLSDSRSRQPGGPRWWDERMVALFGEHLTPNVFACDSQEEARQVADVIIAERRSNPNTVLGSVTSISRFAPPDQDKKLVVIDQIRALAKPESMKLLPKDKREKI